MSSYMLTVNHLPNQDDSYGNYKFYIESDTIESAILLVVKYFNGMIKATQVMYAGLLEYSPKDKSGIWRSETSFYSSEGKFIGFFLKTT